MGTYEDDYDGELYREEDLGAGNEVPESVEELEETSDSEVGEATSEGESSDTVDEIEDEASLAKSYSIDLGDMDLSVEGDEEETGGTASDVLTSEEKMRVYADRVISCCVGDKPISRYAIDRLTTVASPRLFRDENYIIFSVIYAYRSKLRRIHIDEEFLRLFLNRNRNLLQKSRMYIDINAYGEVDGSAELGYIGGVIKHYTRLCNMPEMDDSDFETNFEKYKIEFKAIEASKVY